MCREAICVSAYVRSWRLHLDRDRLERFRDAGIVFPTVAHSCEFHPWSDLSLLFFHFAYGGRHDQSLGLASASASSSSIRKKKKIQLHSFKNFTLANDKLVYVQMETRAVVI